MNDRRAWDTLEQERYEEDYGQAPAVDRCMESKGKKMAIIVSDSGGGDFKRVPAGTHIGRCYRIVDLGTQEITYKGDTKLQRKIMVSWELFGEDDNGEPLLTEDGMPLTISKWYTSSLGDKARLRADLEAWRGKPFTDVELKGFDVASVLDKFCMINVIHNVSDNGKTYANIASITPVPGALKKSLPEPVHEIQEFNIMDPDMAMFESFYEKLQETIKSSFEWRQREMDAGSAPARQTVAAASGAMADLDDDIPFANPYRGVLSYVV